MNEIPSRHPWITALGVAVVAFLVFIPSLSNDFVNWDDNVAVVENRQIRSIDASTIEWMFTTPHNGNWIPFNWLSHALVYQAAGLDPAIHHLANVVLHALNTLLVFFVFLKILGIARAGRAVLVAGAAALFWGISPAHVESVAWVTERKDVGSALFFLLSLLVYLRYASAKNSAGKRRLSLLALCMVFFIFSLLFKPMAITLPVLLLLLDFWPLKRLRSPLGRILLEKAPFFVVSIVFGLVAIWAQDTGVMTFERVPAGFRIMNAFHSIVFYIEKMVVPVGLAPLYPIVDPGGKAFSIGYVLSALLVLAVSAACLFAWLRGKLWPAAACLSYIVLLGPVLGILQVGRQAAADRYTYLPSLVICLVFAAGVFALQERAGRLGGFRRAGRPVLVLFAAGLVVIGALCVKQIGIWRDSITLWEHQVKLYPGVSQTVYSNLAKAYRTERRLDDAIRTYREAVAMSEPHPYTHDGLACALLDKGHVDEAIAELRKAIAKDPDYPAPYRNLWYAYNKKGMPDKALAAVKKAIELSPEFAEAYRNLGISYTRQNRLAQAEEAFLKALSLEPGNHEYLANLATVRMRMGRVDEAIGLFKKALKLNPAEPMLHLNLAIAYEKAGNLDKAIGSYEAALKIDDRLVPAHTALARIYLLRGREDLARRHYEKASLLGGRMSPELIRRFGPVERGR